MIGLKRVEHPKEVTHILIGKNTQDGAGVKLKRVFGGPVSAKITDPFLLLDHFGSSNVEEYISGFPWHPHRGIETVTYLLEGKVYHEDSEGNKGVIMPNDLQWMTAGSGIFHQEMPEPLDLNDPDELMRIIGHPTTVKGFQLWINLPEKDKMTVPTYRDIVEKNVPMINSNGGAHVKVIAGSYDGVQGPFKEAYTVNPTYLDVKLPEESEFTYSVDTGYNSIVYVIDGEGKFNGSDHVQTDAGNALIYSQTGDGIVIRSEDTPLRFLLLSGRPLNEAISWYGPIVMNSDEQLKEALFDLQNDTFIRDRNPIFKNSD